MEFDFLLPGVEELSVSVWDRTSIARLSKVEREALHKVIDSFGRKSAVAQGLSRPVTDSVRLRSTDQRLYLLCEKRGKRRTRVLGGLKSGKKKLFLRQIDGSYDEIMPVCVLDFYVHERCQRQGLGHHIFKEFLIYENEEPSSVAYDRPSPLFMKFLRKHFDLHDYVPQANNFVVFNEYFNGVVRQSGRRELQWGSSSVRGSSPPCPKSGLQRRAITPTPKMPRSSSQNSLCSVSSAHSQRSCRMATLGKKPRATANERGRSRTPTDLGHKGGVHRSASQQPLRRGGSLTPETPLRGRSSARESSATPTLRRRGSAASPVRVPRYGSGIPISPARSVEPEEKVCTPPSRPTSVSPYVPPSRQLMAKSSSSSTMKGPSQASQNKSPTPRCVVSRGGDLFSSMQISHGLHGIEGGDETPVKKSGVSRCHTPSTQHRCVPPWAVDVENDRMQSSSIEPPEDRRFNTRGKTVNAAEYAGSGVGNCLLWV